MNHPWREASPGVRTIDPVVSTRSSRFAAFLDTLPREERRLIELAEKAFVSKTNHFTSPQQATARDYIGGMIGVTDDELTRGGVLLL
jgi:hypothetical protein